MRFMARMHGVAVGPGLGLAVAALLAVPAAAAAPPVAPADSWFRVTSVADRVWRIDDRDTVNAYLIEGDESALLVDTTTGRGDLARCVAALTRRPVQVVATHGHGDHVGGIRQFKKVYVHPADLGVVRAFLPWWDWLGLRTRLVPVRQGDRFDLGHRLIKVIEVPGHTPGSICLLDVAHRLLFTGDNNNGMVWLFLRESTPLATYLQTLRRLNRRAGEFDTILPGHGAPLDAAFIGEQIVCIEHILDGTAEVKPYQWFGGTASVSQYKRAMVAFDPDHLRAELR
jgi:glyoxylase-like metal-dependent hydrolase (beta-lactamase superfamily II)